MQKKIISSYNLKRLKKKDKKIGLCHGVFDVVHYGHLQHLIDAKSKVDILIVSLTSDKFVKKAPHLPINNQKVRAKFLSHFNFIDFVYINNYATSENVIRDLKPDFYFKGADYKKKDITGNLSKEIKILKKNRGKIVISNSPTMSSTKISNNTLLDWQPEQKKFLNYFSKKNAYIKTVKYLDSLSKKEVDIIGEPIIDEYIFGDMVGLTSKDPAMSLVKKSQKTIPGGVIAIAKIISHFVKKVNLYTYGPQKDLETFLKKNKNIKLINISKKLTIQKKTRYLNANRYEKIMQITNIFKNKLENEINNNIFIKLKKNKSKHLLICDYGIDLFSKKFITSLENLQKKRMINVQTNSLNHGFNLFNKYQKYSYLCLDEREWKLGFNNHDEVIKNIIDLSNKKKVPLSLTRGKRGSNLISKKHNYFCPTFINKTIDTTGCGDAYFALTSLMTIINAEQNLIPFIGNSYAGLHGQFFGNEKIIDKVEFLKYLKTILNF